MSSLVGGGVLGVVGGLLFFLGYALGKSDRIGERVRRNNQDRITRELYGLGDRRQQTTLDT